jgi:hypothetical protein
VGRVLIETITELRGDLLSSGKLDVALASDPIIPTSTRVALPRLSNRDPEHILACPMILNYWQTSSKLAVQLAAKKKQSINSSCVASVLRSRRK